MHIAITYKTTTGSKISTQIIVNGESAGAEEISLDCGDYLIEVRGRNGRVLLPADLEGKFEFERPPEPINLFGKVYACQLRVGENKTNN